MSAFPCKNPQCSSYGKPHPNCKCYSEMAEGGEAHFCSSDRSHEDGCQYFAGGGDVVPADDMPDDLSAPVPQEASSAVPADDMPDDLKTAAVPDDDIPDNLKPPPDHYTMPKTGGEAVERAGTSGLLQPTPDSHADGQMVSDDDIKKTLQDTANADTQMGMMIPGMGVLGVAEKGGAAASKFLALGKRGAAALKSAIQVGMLKGSDLVSDSIMGVGNPADAVNNYLALGAYTVLGALGGGAMAEAGIRAMNSSEKAMKWGEKAEKFLAGVGKASSGEAIEHGGDKMVAAGQKAYDTLIDKGAAAAGTIAASKAGGMFRKSIQSIVGDRIVGKGLSVAGKYAVPTIVRWLTSGTQHAVFNMIDYADKVAKGESMINNSVNALFKVGTQQADKLLHQADVKKLRNHIDAGGEDQRLKNEMSSPTPEGYAEGGAVKEPPPVKGGIHDSVRDVSGAMPEHNMLIQTAKGRISNYLMAMKPQQHVARLPFDEEPDDSEQKKNYTKALETAVSPMSVLQHIKSGTLDNDHIQHLNGMYPDLVGHLHQKITERIVKAQMDGEKPSYAVRQGLSMLLGVPLSGEMTPQNIQAAQAVFAVPQGQPSKPQGAEKKKSGTKPLTNSDKSYLTGDQAREARQQRSR